MKKERLGIFVSGNGTTAEHVIREVRSEKIPDMELACIVVCHSGVSAIERLKDLKLLNNTQIAIVDPQEFRIGK